MGFRAAPPTVFRTLQAPARQTFWPQVAFVISILPILVVNVGVTFLNGVGIVLFGGTGGPGSRLLSITRGFRADVCKPHIEGFDENKNGV